jgi:hypothetical protein
MRVRLAVALLSLLLASNAHAADTELCPFLQKVMAAKPQEFAALRGRAAGNVRFEGTLAPSPSFECSIIVRRKSGDKILPPAYRCMEPAKGPLESLAGRYSEMAAAMKACFPDRRFEEEKKDKAWSLKSVDADSEISLGVADMTLAVLIEVAVYDLSPAPSDAEIPVMK